MKLRLWFGLHRLKLTELHSREVTSLDGREIGGLHRGLLVGTFYCLATSSTSMRTYSLAPSTPR
jgi:hypothetical protein